MRVFVTGGTGVLGRRILPDLRKRGHDVVALTRRHDKDSLVAGLGAKPARANLFDREALVQVVRGCDAIVHAATSIPAGRAKPSDYEANDRIRIEGTRALVDVAKAVGARRLVLQGITWVARQPDGAPFDEASSLHPDRVARSAVEMERIGRESGLDVATLRCGWLYASDAAHTRSFGEMLLRGRMPIVGEGNAKLSVVHADDAASAFGAALDANLTGTYHVVDDEPVAVRDYFGELARLVGGPAPRRVPKWLARFAAGKAATEFLTRPASTSNAKLRAAASWAPVHRTYREGLASVVASWRADGTLQAWGRA